MTTTSTAIALALAALGLLGILIAVAYHIGRGVGFDDGVKAARRIHESGARGNPADRAS